MIANKIKIETVLDYMRKNEGIITNAQAISIIGHFFNKRIGWQTSSFLRYYTKTGLFTKIKRGVYKLNENRFGISDSGSILFQGAEFFTTKEEHLFISKTGYVLSIAGNTPKILSPSISNNGYQDISAYKRGQRKHYSVHRMVADAFIPNPENKPHVNHINGVKVDNRVENLEWVTRKENASHAVKLGLILKGENCGASKLSEKEVYEIREMISKNMVHEQIAKKFGVSRRTIGHIKTGETWKHV